MPSKDTRKLSASSLTMVKLSSNLLRSSCILRATLSFFGFCHEIPSLLSCRIASTRSSSLVVRNAASFILLVPYVSDFSITAARYFTDNLRVANGVHNEAEMARCSDGPRICLHSLFLPRFPSFGLRTRASHYYVPPLSCHRVAREKARSTTATSRDRRSTNLAFV